MGELVAGKLNIIRKDPDLSLCRAASGTLPTIQAELIACKAMSRQSLLSWATLLHMRSAQMCRVKLDGTPAYLGIPTLLTP